jgi:hypothetical protein
VIRGLWLFLTIVVLGGCTAKVLPIAAAYEIDLPTTSKRREFIEVLKRALPQGYHIDVTSDEQLKQLSTVAPMTMNVAIWHGRDDDEVFASALDDLDHPGRIWLVFDKGKDARAFASVRVTIIERLRQRWPNMLELPILDNGTIPLSVDLERTSNGYRLRPGAEVKYLNR